MERRLSAILAADIVGYSAQMERDENGTFDRVTERRKDIFEPEIARHAGRIFKIMGDGILAEFSSVMQAVECAVALQSALEDRNRGMPESEAIRARIGINLGEVIVDGDDRYGEGVNIAARLEGLAEPGGICVSEKVAREVEKKLAFGFVSMGAQRVKNIAEPIMVFRVSRNPVPRRFRRRTHPRRWVWATGALCCVAVALIAGLIWMQLPARRLGPPTLAVLPFVNLSGDPAQDYLGPAIAEDIVTFVSTSPLMEVVSRSVSFPAGSAADDTVRTGPLAVDYLLEGSLRRTGDVFHISAQLVDARTGRNLWSNRLEQQGDNVVAMQEAIARKIYVTLAASTGKLASIEQSLSWGKSAPSLEEYDYHLRGAAAYLKFDDGSKEAAEKIWTEGLAAFPESALLRLELAAVFADYAWEGPSDDPWKDIQAAFRLIEEADRKPNKSRIEQWLTHQMKAQILPLAQGDFEAAAREAQLSHAIAPYDVLTNLSASYAMANAGHGDTAVKWAEYAVENAVDVPGWYRDRLAWAYWSAGRPQDAMNQYDQTDYACQTCKISTLMRLGRVAEAKDLMAAFRKGAPDWTLEDERLWPSGRHPTMVDRLMGPYLDDLRAAGLPERP